MTTQSIDISIIIPTYNCAEYLPDCLKSIEAQKFSALEVIIVDDGSTDGSRKFLEKYKSEHDNIRVIYEKGVGPSIARNVAVQVAQGDFLAFLDADDTWTENKLDAQFTFMKNSPETVLTFTNYRNQSEIEKNNIPCFDYWPEFLHVVRQTQETTDYRYLKCPTATLFKENVVGTSTVICRRDAYIKAGGFDYELPSASDWDLWLKLSKLGKVAFTTEIKMNYLVRAGSVSRNMERRVNAMKMIIERHQDDARNEDSNVKRFVNERLMDAYCEYFSSEKPYPKRVAKHVQAFATYPSMRHFKEMIKTVGAVRA